MMNTNSIRSFVADEELAAVRRGHERGLVTDEELTQRLGEVERILWIGSPRSPYRQSDLSVAR
ncbi:MAG TPA: hypothetical protein VF995_01470 [Actinomycetota bacterium]